MLFSLQDGCPLLPFFTWITPTLPSRCRSGSTPSLKAGYGPSPELSEFPVHSSRMVSTPFRARLCLVPWGPHSLGSSGREHTGCPSPSMCSQLGVSGTLRPSPGVGVVPGTPGLARVCKGVTGGHCQQRHRAGRLRRCGFSSPPKNYCVSLDKSLPGMPYPLFMK